MASARQIEKLTDVYALGAMLFELFNSHYFYKPVYDNKLFERALIYLKSKIVAVNSDEERIKIWKKEVEHFKYSCASPKITAPGNTLPASIQPMIEKLHGEMTAFNYFDRVNDLSRVIDRIDIAIRVIQNEAYTQRKLRTKSLFRQNRSKKIAHREARLAEYLAEKRGIANADS